MSEDITIHDKLALQVRESNYISRDLSWLSFNERVLEQAKKESRSIFDRLKFLAITANNLDEFFTIRLGSLHNYIDYGKARDDYSGLREEPFRRLLLTETKKSCRKRWRSQRRSRPRSVRPIPKGSGQPR